MADETFDQDFNPNTTSSQNETPTLDRVILDAIHNQLYDLHTWMPATIVAVRGNQSVDIQLQLKRLYRDGTLVPLPVVQQVMVHVPRGTNYWIRLPISVGDTGIALFCERSLDQWSVAGGLVDPQDIRKHDLSDPIFIPGIYPFNAQTPEKNDDLVLHYAKSEIRIQKAGTFQIKNQQQELFDLLNQLLTVMTTATFTNTLLGPQPFITSTITQLKSIQTKLQTLKGSS